MRIPARAAHRPRQAWAADDLEPSVNCGRQTLMQRILIGMLLAGVVTTGCTADSPAGQATRTSERRTVASPTSRPPVQARSRRRTQVACSQADLGNPGTARMPRPSRVSTTRVVNQVTLGPPLATDRPTISPAQAWDNPQIGKPVAGTYELLLTRLSAPLPATPGADGHLVPQVSEHLCVGRDRSPCARRADRSRTARPGSDDRPEATLLLRGCDDLG
jgi:hypothetical protein